MKKKQQSYGPPIRVTEEAHANLKFLKELYGSKSMSATINSIAVEMRK